MTSWVALLRAVNVGGPIGKLPMTELRRICEEAGFESPRTYIASGNVVFESDDDADKVKDLLEMRLLDFSGQKVDVFVRSARDLRDLVEINPYPGEPGNQVAVLFLDRKPPTDLNERVQGVENETFKPAAREIFIHYPDGLGRSKLDFKLGVPGTTRNMNTVRKLAEMAAG